MNRLDQFKIVQNEAAQLFDKKNKDYGDAFADYGMVGVLVRLGDKVRRCQSISNNVFLAIQSAKVLQIMRSLLTKIRKYCL